MQLWMIIARDAPTANDLYLRRADAEAALAEARRDTWHPEDAALVAQLEVRRIVLDHAATSPN